MSCVVRCVCVCVCARAHAHNAMMRVKAVSIVDWTVNRTVSLKAKASGPHY